MKIRKIWDIHPKSGAKDARKLYKRSMIKKENCKVLKEEKLDEN